MLDEAVSYDRIPYFFSDQHDIGMEYSGYAPEWDEVVFRGDPADGQFIALWLREERVVAGMNVNVWEVNEHVQALIRSHQPIDPAALSDPHTQLDSLLSRTTAEPTEVKCTSTPNPLQRLQAAGVSIWLDTPLRELLDTGEFTKLIQDYAVTGATSNPAIFANAIAGPDRYGSQLRQPRQHGDDDPQQLFLALALDDVGVDESAA